MDESRSLDVLNCELAQKRRRRERGAAAAAAVLPVRLPAVCATFGQVENAERRRRKSLVREGQV